MATRQESLLARARTLSSDGDIAQAMECYREICKSEPFNPDVWLERALVAQGGGLVKEAVRSLFHVADLYARAGMAEAAEVAERVLALDPRHMGARQFLNLFDVRRMGSPAGVAQLLDSAPSGPQSAPASGLQSAPASGLQSAPAAPSGPQSVRSGPHTPNGHARSIVPVAHRSGPQPVARPGSQPGSRPGSQADREPGSQPGSRPGSQADREPGSQPGSRPGSQADREPGSQPGGRPQSPRSTPRAPSASDSVVIPLPVVDMPSGPAAAIRGGWKPAEHAAGVVTPRTEEDSARLQASRKRQLIKSLAAGISSPLLSELDPVALDALIDAGTVERCRRGETIFNQGDSGSSLYLVFQGMVDVERLDPATGLLRRLSTLRAGAFFGEMALLANAPRSATVRASSDTILLKVSRDSVRQLSDRDARVQKLLMRFFRARLVGTLMATSPLFRPLSTEERRALVNRFRLRELPADQVILRQGQPTDGLYLVLVGVLIAFITDPDGHSTELGVLKPGDVFGEMSLLGNKTATASIRTKDPAWVLRLPRIDVEHVVSAHPEILDQLSSIATSRQRQNHRTLTSDPVTGELEAELLDTDLDDEEIDSLFSDY